MNHHQTERRDVCVLETQRTERNAVGLVRSTSRVAANPAETPKSLAPGEQPYKEKERRKTETRNKRKKSRRLSLLFEANTILQEYTGTTSLKVMQSFSISVSQTFVKQGMHLTDEVT